MVATVLSSARAVEVSAEHCITEAERLLQDVTAWLKKNRPQLLAAPK